ncbi:MAG: amidohydrolase family protein [Chthoniobacteraceae bacterium]
MPPRIDAHHHFWNYTPEEFDWIDDSMAGLRRNFAPEDLEPCLAEVGIDGVVSVQARQTLEETEFLLGLARRHPFIRGVVGWVPLISASVGEALARLAQSPKLRAVRHVLQGEADERYMLREDFNRGVARLAPLGLAYDILIFEWHLPQTLEFVDRHPNQVFVLDHVAKPPIREGRLDPWASEIRNLARRENVFCKISGMLTEADHHHWTEAQLRPYFDTVLEAFGPGRLMFGSDWPVCLAATSYKGWHSAAQRLAENLSANEKAALFGGTAQKAYRLA